MIRKLRLRTPQVKCSLAIVLLVLAVSPSVEAKSPRSKSIASVLREPLPPEELTLTTNRNQLVITGPTFAYLVDRTTGVFSLSVQRDGRDVISPSGPADIVIDDYRLSSKLNPCQVEVLEVSPNKIVIESSGALRRESEPAPEMDFAIRHTFYNDGVAVSTVRLRPRSDFPVRKEIAYQLSATGEFSNYLHKRRDEHGQEAARGRLPATGQSIRFATLTSCLSVYSPTTALAIFTDGGAVHLSKPNLETATIDIDDRSQNSSRVSLTQYIVRVNTGDAPFVLKGGQEFIFRVGTSIAPNRLPHPRIHDLRMFIWIGDAKYPYPTDAELTQIAHWGYTVFQLHRAGTPGDPRPPAGEFARVLKKVHELGMLYVWEENADLLYDSAPAVQALKAKGQWPLWQGFNYDGRYTASMDPYCDLIATCLASPNGLAEYRLANIQRMMEQSPVDGIYLDDNLGYPNCYLQKEHNHPRKVYDCLIELHEINWRRREFMREKIPHLLLISHNTKAFVVPVLSSFDIQYFAEGYCFDSAQDYWENYRAWSLGNNAQGMICPGDDEGSRCAASLICNYDLLTGGGQYNQMDWRMFPEKFSYAGGVRPIERAYSQVYNLAQYYFGMYESEPHYFATSTNLFRTTAPQTFASLYRNTVWRDYLIPFANMSATNRTSSLQLLEPQKLGLKQSTDYLIFDVHRRTVQTLPGSRLNDAFKEISVPAQNLELFSVRPIASKDAPLHVWGGKRISETWDRKQRKLTIELQGPPSLQDSIFIRQGGLAIERILVDGKESPFFFDASQALVHGEVTFKSTPSKVEVHCLPQSTNQLPAKNVTPDALVQQNPIFKK